MHKHTTARLSQRSLVRPSVVLRDGVNTDLVQLLHFTAACGMEPQSLFTPARNPSRLRAARGRGVVLVFLPLLTMLVLYELHSPWLLAPPPAPVRHLSTRMYNLSTDPFEPL